MKKLLGKLLQKMDPRKTGCRACETAQRESGFTIIEIAIVLMIFGVVVGGGLVNFAHIAHRMKVDTTEKKFDMVLDALSSYSQKYKRLPCPADPGAGAALQGFEVNGGNCFNSASENALYDGAQGVVPWKELGIPESIVRDGWGRFFTYKPAPQLTINHLDANMQNYTPGGGDLDVHDACRSPSWYSTERIGTDVTHTHVDRGKAMFCCSRAPNADYLTSIGQPANLPNNWRMQSVAAAGVLPTGGLSSNSVTPGGVAVQNTAAWRDADDDNSQVGDFDDPDHGLTANGDDAPLARAMGPAVTLISHGGNGFMSFLEGQGGNTRLQGTYAAGAAPTLNAPVADDEALNVWPPQLAAATVYNPKTAAGAYDPMGKRAGASDDRVATVQTDQLFSRVGAATCLRPSFSDFNDVCIPDSYDDVTYVLDTSGSMGGNFGIHGRRIDVAKQILRAVMEKHLRQELSADDDFDLVGFTGFDGNDSQYTDDTAFFKPAFTADANGDGIIDASDDLNGDGTIGDITDIAISVDAYMAATGRIPTDNPGVIDYDIDGDPANLTVDELKEARIEYGMDRIDDQIAGSGAGGCTPVIETSMAQANTLLKQAETNICRQIIAADIPDGATSFPSGSLPSECTEEFNEFVSVGSSQSAFQETFATESFDPDKVEPNGIVLLSDGGDTCSNVQDGDFDMINGTLDDGTPINRINQYLSGGNGANAYNTTAAFIEKASRDLSNKFKTYGYNVNKRVNIHIVDMVGNDDLTQLGERPEVDPNDPDAIDKLICQTILGGGNCSDECGNPVDTVTN